MRARTQSIELSKISASIARRYTLKRDRLRSIKVALATVTTNSSSDKTLKERLTKKRW